MSMIFKHDFGVRPICINDDCNRECQFMGSYRIDGTPQFRKYCTPCHHERQAKKKGQTKTEWINAMHPYLKYRKTYCENKDGRFGFKCKYKIVFSGQLQVDHINGNPTDHSQHNLQTLCANCHIFKTHSNGDRATPGRKYFSELLKSVAKKQRALDISAE